MTEQERETVININQADSKEGYFVFGTSIHSHANKIKKIVGKYIISETINKNINGEITWYSFKIPSDYLSPSFAIRKKVVRSLSPEQLEIQRKRMLAMRLNSKKNK